MMMIESEFPSPLLIHMSMLNSAAHYSFKNSNNTRIKMCAPLKQAGRISRKCVDIVKHKHKVNHLTCVESACLRAHFYHK